MEAGNCPTLNMNALHNYLLSQSLTHKNVIEGFHNNAEKNVSIVFMLVRMLILQGGDTNTRY